MAAINPKPFGDSDGLITDPIERARILLTLGIKEDWLTGAIEVAHAARRRSSSKLHPPMAAGFQFFAEGFTALATAATKQGGWAVDHQWNFSRIVSPNAAVAVAFVRGDEGTGTDGPLSTPFPRGTRTAIIVQGNRNFSLPFDARYEADNAPGDESSLATATWFLVHHRAGGRVMCELSLPRRQDADGYVVSWNPRIHLATFESNGTRVVSRGPSTPPAAPPTIRVERRDV